MMSKEFKELLDCFEREDLENYMDERKGKEVMENK